MLYAVAIGLLVGLLLGGRVGRLAGLHLHWAWAAIAGFLTQIVLFSAPVTAVVGDLGPPLYVASTLLVLAVVIRNVPEMRGLALVALGAACNLAAIMANGGYMPATPEVLAATGRGAAVGYSNSVGLAQPALEPLVDRFTLPSGLPWANVFSVGDILIGLGIVAVIVVAMRWGDAAAAAPADTGRAAASPGVPGAR